MNVNRPPESAAEIASLPAPGTTEREAYVRAHADRFTPETLVFLLREALGSGNTALFERCAIALAGRVGPGGNWVGGHCEAMVWSMARSFGFRNDPETLQDFRQQCHMGMWRAIHAGVAEKPFWEARFGLALKHSCIDEGRMLVRRLKELEWADERAELPEDAVGEGEDRPGLDAQVWDRIVEQDLRAAVRRLPPRQARAAFLTWIEGRPVGSDDPRSVKNLMGVTEQAVYALLRKAKVTLAADPELRKYLEDR